MEANRLKSFCARFALLAYLFTFAVRVDGLVLCLGQDGHMELEAASAELTCEVSVAAVASLGALFMPQDALADDHCGPCTDIALMLVGPDTVAGRRAPVIPAQEENVKSQFFAARTSFHLLAILDEKRAAPLQQSAVAKDPLASLRTIILLI